MTVIKNIVIISALYPPEPQVSARMSYDLSNYLAVQRYCITVLCPQPSRPLNAEYKEYRNVREPVVTHDNKIKTVRLHSFVAPRSRLLPRMWESFSFGWEVIKYLTEVEEKPDVIYVNSWPMISQALIARFSKKNSIPMVLQIMDIYPEALSGKLPPVLRTVLQKALKWLDVWIAQTAAAVVVISDNMRRTYTEGRKILAERVITIPTWHDEIAFENTPSRSEACRIYGIPEQPFTFLFLGNIGPVAGVDFLIRAFAEADIYNSQLVIVGDGASKSDCVALVQRLNLSNVFFISDPDAVNTPLLQSMAHVCMLPMKAGSGLSSIPSKFPSYLFSAKPVIATVDGDSDTARLVIQSECGWVGEAENVSWLVNKMKEVTKLSIEELAIIGRRGKKFGLENFSKSTGVVRLATTVTRASSNRE